MFKSSAYKGLIHKKAYPKFWLKLFLCGFYLFSASYLLQAHELDRLHEHVENNTYRVTPRAVQIRFTAPKIAGDAIKVTTRFQATGGTYTELKAETFWSGTSNDNLYTNIQAFSDNGARMLLKKTGDRKWRVNTNIGQWVEVHYFIQANNNADLSNTQYRAILNKSIFHGAGRLFLVLPNDKMNELFNVNIKWQNFEGINWQTVQAVAANPQQDQYEIVSKSALLSSVFMAGDFDLHQVLTPYGIVKIAVQKNDWRFTDEEFSSLARKIVQSEREFFNVDINPDAEPFLISLVEVDRNLNGISISGTSLHNSFAMFSSPKAQLMQTDYSEPNTTIGFVLAHEMMHQWIGTDLQTNETPEALGYWFTEGFTDYFSLQVLYQYQLITLPTYIEMLNGFLRNYWLSAHRNLNNNKVAKSFWRDVGIQKIPYLRGFLIALSTDQSMRLRSNIRLQNLLQKMLDKSDGMATNTGVSNKALLYNLEKHIGKEQVNHLRNVMQNGKTIQLNFNLLNPCLKIQNKQFGDYDPGFDLDKSEVEMVISGLTVSAAAYKAGLRNGNEIAGWSFTPNPRENSSVSIYTDKRGTVKTFEFLPVDKTTAVPQAILVNSENCAAIL